MHTNAHERVRLMIPYHRDKLHCGVQRSAFFFCAGPNVDAEILMILDLPPRWRKCRTRLFFLLLVRGEKAGMHCTRTERKLADHPTRSWCFDPLTFAR
jgi:hypothetical protein